MNTLRVLGHLMRADFLERVRRYSFLVTLGLVLWLGYLSASGQIRMRVAPDYVGVVNSAWAGTTMALTVAFALGWIGFYLVKGSVNRDYVTGVGQIMATTPLSRPAYTLGKWLSNFAVLAVMIVLLFVAGIAMMLWIGEGPVDVWALAAPLVFLALPVMALVAAVAVLFETIGFLRGGLGNIVYFGLFLVLMSLSLSGSSFGSGAYRPYADFSGMQLVGQSALPAALAAYPEGPAGFTFSFKELADPKLFTWSGLEWTGEIIVWRVLWLVAAFAIALLAAVPFDRFNPSRVLTPSKVAFDPRRWFRRAVTAPAETGATAGAAPVAAPRLTPLDRSSGNRFRFDALFLGELKLLIKGLPWWWYAVAAGLAGTTLFVPADTARMLLIAAWTWPVLILSGLGCREARFDTRQIVFSAPRPLLNQLPAAWLSGVVLLAAAGLGGLLRFAFAGEFVSVAGWFVGIFFVPSLALALGVVTGASKPFEALYIFWMYGLTQKVPPLDFAGLWPESAFIIYALLVPALLVVAVFARRQQLVAGHLR
jgi:hypothetical protein